MPAIGGTAVVRANGQQYPLKGDFVVSPSPTQRTGVAGMDGVHGYTEAYRLPFIAGTLSTLGELSIEELANITDATVQADLNNGRSYVLHEAFTTSAFEINTSAGSVAIRWEGTTCDEF
ncbi:phage tail tube protein [Methylobacterium oryzisoli]|uniref:phage tail tube protein n=1 Tax=Methylobacterium oryzisoli TaxID=3385502 RepID=UPI0038911A62